MKKLILISVVHIVFLIGCSQKNESTASSLIAKSDQAMSRIDEKEIVKCSTIENQIQRLSCYDEFASRHGQVAISKHTDIANKGIWQIGSDVDPLTDKTVLHAQLIAESGKREIWR